MKKSPVTKVVSLEELSIGYGVWICGRMVYWCETESEMNRILNEVKEDTNRFLARIKD